MFLSTSVNNFLSVYLKSPITGVAHKVIYFLPFYLFLFCAIFLNFIVQYHFDGLDYLKFEPVAFVSIHRTDWVTETNPTNMAVYVCQFDVLRIVWHLQGTPSKIYTQVHGHSFWFHLLINQIPFQRKLIDVSMMSKSQVTTWKTCLRLKTLRLLPWIFLKTSSAI